MDTYNCPCRAHRQHALYRLLFNTPGINLAAAAKELGLTYPNVRMIKSRLARRPDLSRLCPECFRAAFYRGVCQACGFEAAQNLPKFEVLFDSQSPVHSIQPLNGLGSEVDYTGLHLQYGARNLQHLAERVQDHFLEEAKKELWEELKTWMPPDGLVDEATKLLIREVRHFRARYPLLTQAHNARTQLVQNVIALLRLRYPNLRNSATVLVNGEAES